MKKKLVILMLILAFVLTAAACGAKNASAAAPNAVDLYFPSNPTTGYQWLAQVGDSKIVDVTDRFDAADASQGLVGAGGTHWFHFDGLAEGSTTVTLTYARSWEDGEPVYSFVYSVKVDAAKNVLITSVEMAG